MQTPQEGGGFPVADEPFDDLEQPDVGETDDGIEPEADEQETPQPEPEGGEPAAEAAPRRPGRRERQQAEIRNLRQENERLRRDFEGFRSQQQRPAGPDPAEVARRDQAEREHVATLDYGAQAQYWADKRARETQAQIAQMQIGVAQQIDKSTWDAACRADPVRAQFSAEVERLFQDEARAGRMQAREVLFTYVYGQEALRARQRQTAGQRQAAARRVAAQTTRPGGVRSDGTASRQPAGNSYEAALARIKGQPLW